MDDKILTPTVIADTPFPTLDMNPLSVTTQSAKTQDSSTPSSIQDQPFPQPMQSQQLTSTKLNTATKKILGSFDFSPSGGIKIGDFTKGQNGEIDISPAGILAINLNGDTTFSIDGETGDATFKGTILAGSIIANAIISGDITLGGKNNGNGILKIFDINNLEVLKVDNNNFTIINSSNDVSFNVNYAQEIVEIGDLILGKSGLLGTIINSSGSLRVYDSNILFAELNVDEGLHLYDSKHINLTGTVAAIAPSPNSLTLYIDQSGGKNRLMVRFPTGAAQQVAIEP